MSKIYVPLIVRGTISAFVLLAGIAGGSAAYAGDYIRKDHRDIFLSPTLKKEYYRRQIQTLRFFDRQHSSVNGLIESFRGTSCYSYDIFTRVFCHSRQGVLDCQAFTYDNAVAAMTYLIAGHPRRTADLLKVYRKEFYVVKNDLVGLYNSYRTDVEADRYGGLTLGIDGDRIHVGPTMWIALAALQYTAMTEDLQFLSFVIDMAKWAQRLPHFRFSDGQKGAVCMGSGWGPDWSGVYSTENNVDYYAVITMLREIYSRGDEHVRSIYMNKQYLPADMDAELHNLARWFSDVAYDQELRMFRCGYNENGPDKTPALDNVSWTIAAIGPEQLSEWGINPFDLIRFAEKQFLVKTRINNEKIEGFDLTNAQGRNRPLRVVWMEGTGIQTVTYQVMARYARAVGMAETADEYQKKAIKFSGELQKAADQVRLIENALPYTSKCPKEKEIIMTFAYEWEIPRGDQGQWVASASSTAWRYFALAGFNPMVFDHEVVSYPLFSGRHAGQQPAGS